jgi:phage baseplate assembly protein W
MATLQKIYSDIDFAFTKKPVTADIALKYDTQAVIRSIRNLLSTQHYERHFNPDLGSKVQTMLFENMDMLTATSIQREIINLIERFEPRALLQSVQVDARPEDNAYDVSITFFIENATTPTTITLLLERIR